MTELQDFRVLVTGASRGIGLAIASKLAASGCKVAGLATAKRNLDAAEETVQDAGGEFLRLEGDIGNPETAVHAAEAIIEAWGGIDGLVANAGITRDKLLLRMKPEDFEDVLRVNLGGAFHLAKACIRPMMKQRFGRIVFMGSVVAKMGNPGQANYCASKAGLHGLARSIALELGGRGITANVVAPGFIDTDMTSALPAEGREAMIGKTALGRIGQPGDIAAAVRFLLGPDGSYITGQILTVDGGLSLA